MTRRYVLPAVYQTGKRSVWSVKIDSVDGIQDAKMLCILAPVWMDNDRYIGGVFTSGDLLDL